MFACDLTKEIKKRKGLPQFTSDKCFHATNFTHFTEKLTYLLSLNIFWSLTENDVAK